MTLGTGGAQVAFTCNGAAVDVAVAEGESLLSVLRERLGVLSAKDGCAPQGQCGCCTVLVDGEPRVACVTPASRLAGRSVTTLEGLDVSESEAFSRAFVGTGGSQCGFCTPGIVVRAAALARRGKVTPAEIDRALAAHLCSCTGWVSVREAIEQATALLAVHPSPGTGRDGGGGRLLDAAARRAAIEAGVPQRVEKRVPLGDAGFADDTAPSGALVVVPLPPGSAADSVDAAGMRFVVAESLTEARTRAGKVQGRRSPAAEHRPIEPPDLPAGGVRLATGWVEPAYLEPDASWCEPGGEPASPLANGGAFGGKASSPAPAAARELASRFGRAVRVVFSREDVVRLGPKRPPMAASAVFDDGTVRIVGAVARAGIDAFAAPHESPYRLDTDARWRAVDLPGPAASPDLRAAGWAEHALLVEGALDASGADRVALLDDERAGEVLLDTCVAAPGGALAGARVHLDPVRGELARVEVRVAAGDPLDDVVLRSYAIGAVGAALGWVLSERLGVDPVTGEVLDLTIRSLGVIRARDMPPVDVAIVGEPGPPLPRSSDAVFAAVAAAAWNALALSEGARPESFPARSTRAARPLRR